MTTTPDSRALAEGYQIRFENSPPHIGGRFVDVEDLSGRSIRLGEWKRDGEYWLLVVAGQRDAQQGT